MILTAESHEFSFPKAFRLRKRTDFLSLKDQDEAFFDRNFVVAFKRSGSGRIGITLSRRVLKNATARNRVKRLIREFFRHHRSDFAELDLNVIGRGKLSDCWDKMGPADIESLFTRFSKVLRKKDAPSLQAATPVSE